MWEFFLVARSRHGTVRLPLVIQEYDVKNSEVLHLKARKGGGPIIRALRLEQNVPSKLTHPLFYLDSLPYAVQLECEGLEVIRDSDAATRHKVIKSLGSITVQPIDNDKGYTVFASDNAAADFSVRMHALSTDTQNEISVWRVNCTIYTRSVKALEISGMISAARMQHIISCECGKKSKSKGHVNAGIEATMTDDLSALAGFTIAYKIESGQPFLHTETGHLMLTSHTPPANVMAISSSGWIARAAEEMHAPGVRDLVHGHSPEYYRDAEMFKQQLTEGVVDYMRDLWSGTTKGIKVSVQKLMPSPETVAVLKSINVKKLADRTKTVLTSKTVEAVIKTLSTNPSDIIYLETWGKAVLGDLKIDESAIGQLVIDNAPAVEESMRKMLTKLQYLKGVDIAEYGAQFRELIGNPDLADGVIQLAAMAKRAGKFLADNSDKVVSAAKGAVKLAAAGAETIAAL